jgi:hypothetical protein
LPSHHNARPRKSRNSTKIAVWDSGGSCESTNHNKDPAFESVPVLDDSLNIDTGDGYQLGELGRVFCDNYWYGLAQNLAERRRWTPRHPQRMEGKLIMLLIGLNLNLIL